MQIKPKITFFHRKARAVGNYSVEFIFADVRRRLGDDIISVVVESKYESSGIFKRIFNCIQAYRNQSQINHVTGDINYVGLLLQPSKTIHTILDCVHLRSSKGIKHRVLKLFWLTIPLKRAAFITAISDSTKKEILKYTACDPDKIKVIHVAISDRFHRKDKEFNKLQPRILQIGTAPNKNIPRLIEAVKDIPCVLEIVGRADAGYEVLLKKYQINYEFKSNLSEEEMIARYEAADIVSLVSTYE